MATDIFFHDEFTKHVLSAGHPESPKRLETALQYINSRGLLENGKVRMIQPDFARIESIVPIHDTDYLEEIRKKSEKGGGFFTLDTSVNQYTYSASLLAAGAGILGADRVVEKESENGYVLCRPPGHHAERRRAFGFCFINNVAVAAHHLTQQRELERVLIVDYDAHHGNGTQNAFYDRRDVLYIGLHQDGRTLFPGSGFPNEIGVGEGKGYNVNLSMYPGAGDLSYQIAFEEIVEPIADSFRPEIVLVSAGFDGHFGDPLTNLGLTMAGLAMMNSNLKKIAEHFAHGRIIFFLEGGYNLDVVGGGSLNLVEELSDSGLTQFNDEYVESEICIDMTRKLIGILKDNLRGIHF
ncbi:MAG: histone deacetylase [Candidatus Thorarchaeota archaeon]